MLKEDKLNNYVIDLSAAKNGQINESFLAMFGWWTKFLLRKMLGDDVLAPVSLKGSRTDVYSFYKALASEKDYISKYKNYGLNDPRTLKDKAKLKGAIDKTFNWIDSTDSWTSSEHIELASGKNFRIDGVSVVSKTGLGSTVVASSLTSLGTISSGVWSGTDIAVAHGGTGASTASAARTNLGLVIGTDVEPHSDQLTELATMNANTASALADLTQTEVQIIDGLTVTTAEINKLDGATITTTELNIIDGDSSVTATTLTTTDRMVVNDAGVMKQVAFSDLVTFLENGAVSGFDLDGGTY